MQQGNQPPQQPQFKPITQKELQTEDEIREVHVPGQRFNYVKENWPDICKPIVSQLKLNIRLCRSMRLFLMKQRAESGKKHPALSGRISSVTATG